MLKLPVLKVLWLHDNPCAEVLFCFITRFKVIGILCSSYCLIWLNLIIILLRMRIGLIVKMLCLISVAPIKRVIGLSHNIINNPLIPKSTVIKSNNKNGNDHPQAKPTPLRNNQLNLLHLSTKIRISQCKLLTNNRKTKNTCNENQTHKNNNSTMWMLNKIWIEIKVFWWRFYHWWGNLILEVWKLSVDRRIRCWNDLWKLFCTYIFEYFRFLDIGILWKDLVWYLR